MLGCLALAFIAPFEAFVFSFALLSPLHYFTEISWLHQKQYFAPKKWDFLPLLLLVVALVAVRFVVPGLGSYSSSIVALGFLFAFVFVAFPKGKSRLIASLFALLFVWGFSAYSWYFVFFSIFLTTIVHTFLFTGSFIFYGALKSKSVSGIFSLFVFGMCVVLCFALQPQTTPLVISGAIQESYAAFWVLNERLIQFFGGEVNVFSDLYSTSFAIKVMRFITFSYTYHFANWFSKTSVIGWINPAKKYSAFILTAWLSCVAIFLYDYAVGMSVIYAFGMLHVFLEFPLNHQTFLGIGRMGVQKARQISFLMKRRVLEMPVDA